ncbi:MAG: hypothetical protein ACXVLX_11235 [Ilumatobacteraceae bacterium]
MTAAPSTSPPSTAVYTPPSSTIPVHFSPGTSSASLPLDALDISAPIVYSLRAAAGQELTFGFMQPTEQSAGDLDFNELTSSEGRATIRLIAPDGRTLASGATHGSRWLPLDGVYVLELRAGSIPPGVDETLAVSINNHSECHDCNAGPTWTTVHEDRMIGGYRFTTQLPDFSDERMHAAIDRWVTEQMQPLASDTEFSGYEEIVADVLLSSPNLVAVQFQIEYWADGTPHPWMDFDQLTLDAAGNEIDPSKAVAVSRDGDGNWTGLSASVLDRQVRAHLQQSFGDVMNWTTTGGLFGPGLDGVNVAYARCELESCALDAVRVVVPYAEVPGIATPLLATTLAGPVATGD